MPAPVSNADSTPADVPEALLQALPSLLASQGLVYALQRLIEAVVRHPDHAGVRQALADLLDGVALGTASPTVRTVVARLLEDPAVSAQALAGAALGPAMSTPSFAVLREAARTGRAPEADAVAAFTSDALVVAALPKLVGFNLDLEAVLAHLRRMLLAQAVVGEGGALRAPVPLAFVCALAGHTFAGEYPWDETAEDAAVLRTLAARADTALAALAPDAPAVPEAAERAVALLAGWRPLHALPVAAALHRLADAAWSPPLRALRQQQLVDPEEEARRGAALPALTPVADGVSEAVRAMYEVNPYPRWLTARHPAPQPLAAFLRHWRPERDAEAPADRILVAGCGTGHQAVQLALSFPAAQVDAFDLSRRSLGYAVRMAEGHGAARVRFAQGDLLAFHTSEPYDLVSCSGVLHHLGDPLAGWRRLRAALRPDGIMKVGLYSTLARRGIAEAQRLVASLGHGSDDAGLRRSRAALLALPEGHPARAVFGFADAFSLSGFRDLVCHVQERSYTVPELQAALDAVGMRFLGFQLPAAVLARFTDRHGEGAVRDLAAWDAFEQAHPDTFAAMYQFWCAPT